MSRLDTAWLYGFALGIGGTALVLSAKKARDEAALGAVLPNDTVALVGSHLALALQRPLAHLLKNKGIALDAKRVSSHWTTTFTELWEPPFPKAVILAAAPDPSPRGLNNLESLARWISPPRPSRSSIHLLVLPPGTRAPKVGPGAQVVILPAGPMGPDGRTPSLGLAAAWAATVHRALLA